MVDGGQENLCASYDCEAGTEVTVYCNGGSKIGDTIKVMLRGSGRTLTMCEIRVYGLLVN